MCGRITQFLSLSRGWSVGSGSGVVTSRPAAAIWPPTNASYRSSWFTTAPLLVLMNTEVFFILLKKSLLHIPWVSGVKAHVTTTKSDSWASFVRGTNSA